MLPLISEVASPSSFSTGWSNCSNISTAAAIPFWITAFILVNCLIGFAMRPAAVKNATKVSASSLIDNPCSKAIYATNAREKDIRIWTIGVAKELVASNLRFCFLFALLAKANLLLS